MIKTRIRKGFGIKEWSFKTDYSPTIKREPVYNFLKRTINRQDTEKQKVKDVTSKFIHSFFLGIGVKKIKMISLPGVTWEFERKLRKTMAIRTPRIRVALTGCEIDYKVFCLSASKMPGSPNENLSPYFSDNLGHYVVTNQHAQVYLINADMFDVMNKGNDKGIKYDVAWFDTTHTVISISRKLEDISHIMSDNSVLVFTVLKGREHVKFDTNRTDYLTNVVSPMGYTLSKELPYFDTCPMLHLIYTKTA